MPARQNCKQLPLCQQINEQTPFNNFSTERNHLVSSKLYNEQPRHNSLNSGGVITGVRKKHEQQSDHIARHYPQCSAFDTKVSPNAMFPTLVPPFLTLLCYLAYHWQCVACAPRLNNIIYFSFRMAYVLFLFLFQQRTIATVSYQLTNYGTEHLIQTCSHVHATSSYNKSKSIQVCPKSDFV